MVNIILAGIYCTPTISKCKPLGLGVIIPDCLYDWALQLVALVRLQTLIA